MYFKLQLYPIKRSFGIDDLPLVHQSNGPHLYIGVYYPNYYKSSDSGHILEHVLVYERIVEQLFVADILEDTLLMIPRRLTNINRGF